MSTNRVNPEDCGITIQEFKDMYLIEGVSLNKISHRLNVSYTVLNRWLKEYKVPRNTMGRGRYRFNQHFFDEIDSEEKAYWIGFIWCDGYVLKRERENNKIEYQTKISLSSEDTNHLEKLKSSMQATHPINFYENKTGFKTEYHEARLMFSNKYLGEQLQEEYGLIPHRQCVYKLINKIPHELKRHFIRGVFDADGNMNPYTLVEKHSISPSIKATFNIYTYEELCMFIQEYFLEQGITKQIVKMRKRHEERDGNATGLAYAGARQVSRIMEHLYNDSTVYMSRKHRKYIELLKMLDERKNKN